MGKYLDKQGVAKLWNKTKKHVSDALEASIDDKLGAEGGLATLDSNGKLNAEQLPDLKTINGQSIVGTGDITIDLGLYQVVESLASVSSPNPNKIYLVLSETSGSQNLYTEYVYVNSAWEKVGEYKAAIDLDPYLKKEEAETTYVKQKANYDLSKNDFTDELKDKLEKTPKFVGVASQEELDKINPKDDNTFYYIEGEPIEYLTPEEAEEMFVKADELADKLKESGEFVTFEDFITSSYFGSDLSTKYKKKYIEALLKSETISDEYGDQDPVDGVKLRNITCSSDGDGGYGLNVTYWTVAESSNGDYRVAQRSKFCKLKNANTNSDGIMTSAQHNKLESIAAEATKDEAITDAELDEILV